MPSPTPRPARTLAYLPLIISGVCALLAAQMAAQDPRYLIPFVAILALTFVPALLARQRMRKLLISGDVKRVLGTWEGSIERVMYPETMAPLMAATAYASYGWIEAARNALARAVKGPVWDAAIEQRLFVEALLDTFEGDRSAALDKAKTLAAMPIPAGGVFTRKRVATMRQGIFALARAFAHESEGDDKKVLEKAAAASPLVHWAMRYAAAIIAIDQGKAAVVPEMLAGAPAWPKESAFRIFHEELLAKAESTSPPSTATA